MPGVNIEIAYQQNRQELTSASQRAMWMHSAATMPTVQYSDTRGSHQAITSMLVAELELPRPKKMGEQSSPGTAY